MRMAGKEVVQVFEVGRIKRSADPAWNFDSTSIQWRARTNAGSASLRSLIRPTATTATSLAASLRGLDSGTDSATARISIFSAPQSALEDV